MQHADEAQVSAYLDKQLEYADPEARRDLGRHIADCSKCSKLLKEMRLQRTEAEQLLGTTGPAQVAVPSFQDVVRRAQMIRSMEESSTPAAGFDSSVITATPSPEAPDAHVVEASDDSESAGSTHEVSDASGERDEPPPRETHERPSSRLELLGADAMDVSDHISTVSREPDYDAGDDDGSDLEDSTPIAASNMGTEEEPADVPAESMPGAVDLVTAGSNFEDEDIASDKEGLEQTDGFEAASNSDEPESTAVADDVAAEEDAARDSKRSSSPDWVLSDPTSELTGSAQEGGGIADREPDEESQPDSNWIVNGDPADEIVRAMAEEADTQPTGIEHSVADPNLEPPLEPAAELSDPVIEADDSHMSPAGDVTTEPVFSSSDERPAEPSESIAPERAAAWHDDLEDDDDDDDEYEWKGPSFLEDRQTPTGDPLNASDKPAEVGESEEKWADPPDLDLGTEFDPPRGLDTAAQFEAPADSESEVESPKGLDLGTEFESPPGLDLGTEFEAPGGLEEAYGETASATPEARPPASERRADAPARETKEAPVTPIIRQAPPPRRRQSGSSGGKRFLALAATLALAVAGGWYGQRLGLYELPFVASTDAPVVEMARIEPADDRADAAPTQANRGRASGTRQQVAAEQEAVARDVATAPAPALPAEALAAAAEVLGTTEGDAFAQAAGELRGTVVDSETGDPLVNVRVVTADGSVAGTTDANGEYALPGVPPGEVRLRALSIGYVTQEKNVTVEAAGSADADFALPRATVALDEIVVAGADAGEAQKAEGDSVKILADTQVANAAPPAAARRAMPSTVSTWVTVDQREAEGVLGGLIVGIRGLPIEEISRSGDRTQVQIRQRMDSGEAIVLVISRAQTEPGREEQAAKEVRDVSVEREGSESVGQAMFGNYRITARAPVPTNVLETLLGVLIETARSN